MSIRIQKQLILLAKCRAGIIPKKMIFNRDTGELTEIYSEHDQRQIEIIDSTIKLLHEQKEQNDKTRSTQRKPER